MDRIKPVITDNIDVETHAINVASTRRKWLAMLLDTGNKKVATAYQKYDQLHKENIKNSGIMPKSGAVGPVRPVTVNELSRMSNVQIAEYLNDYKETEIFGLSMLKGQGIGDTLTKCVEANPQRFTDNLLPFQGVRNLYLSSLLQGFHSAWREEKEFDWAALLNFICQILSSEQFWIEQYETGFNYRNWFFSGASDLISDGTKNDKNAFDAELLPVAEQILLVLIQKAKQSVYTLNNLSTDVLNSDRGKVFSAMVNYALRFSRINDAELGDSQWPQAIKTDFTKRLDRNVEPSIEFSYTLGFYLPYLSYLDKKWVVDNIDFIFPQHNEDQWQAAFSGYLLYPRISEEFCFLLKTHGHYEKALRTNFSDTEVQDKLVRHICTGWIEDNETMEDKTSLIYQLIHSDNPALLSGIVYFFSRQSNNLSEKIKRKIMPAWHFLFQVLIQNNDVEDYQKVLCPLLGWLELIETIDAEVSAWIKESIKHIGIVPGYGMTLSRLFKALLKHAQKTPIEVGEIYMHIPQRIMKNLQTQENEIKETIRILYNKGYKETADKICNRFTENEVEFLRPVYMEFQH